MKPATIAVGILTASTLLRMYQILRPVPWGLGKSVLCAAIVVILVAYLSGAARTARRLAAAHVPDGDREAWLLALWGLVLVELALQASRLAAVATR
jgi:hypothetical protein